MYVTAINEKSIQVIGSDGQRLLVAKEEDQEGTFFLDENLEKEYCHDPEGRFIGDATYWGS